MLITGIVAAAMVFMFGGCASSQRVESGSTARQNTAEVAAAIQADLEPMLAAFAQRIETTTSMQAGGDVISNDSWAIRMIALGLVILVGVLAAGYTGYIILDRLMDRRRNGNGKPERKERPVIPHG